MNNSDYSARRLERTRTTMSEQGLDALYVRGTSSIAWMTAFDDVFDDEQAHAVLVGPDAAALHTDSRYALACRTAAEGGPVDVEDDRVSHAKWAARRLKAAGAPGVVGIEDDLPLREFRALEAAFADEGIAPRVVETADFVPRLRAVKDAMEIERMRATQAITDAAFAHITAFIRPGMTEREVQVELEDFMYRHGSVGLAFSSIVATGPDAAMAHAIPGPARLEAGQCVVMDFGARSQGYCSDMTRTVFIGEPSARLRDAYAAVREANETVEALLAPGVTGAFAHNRAEEVLAAHGFAGKMGHALGHGVGIDIHESPVLAPRNKEPLVPGNVVTVEPGVYFDGEFGMRLEDFGVITETGYDVFTRSTHDMVIL